MNDSIVINGRNYKVKVIGQDRAHPTLPKYHLQGLGGARYVTLRNQKNPHAIFLISARSWGAGAMRGVWLSDEGGELHQVEVAR